MTDHNRLYEYAQELTVLCVDDNAPLLEEMRSFLSRYFKNVLTAVNALSALQTFSEKGCDLVVTDITMPGMNGIAMIEAMRKRQPYLPVIVISGYDNSDNLKALLDLKIDHFATKPIHYHHLTRMLAESTISIHEHHASLAYVKELEDRNETLDRSITEQTDAAEQSVYLDSLTGLRNFCCFMSHIRELHEDANQFISLMLIDIDRLKEVNDLFGTEAGDAVIVGFSRFLDAFTRGTTYKVFRTLGDQFGLMDNAPYIDTEKYEQDLERLLGGIRELRIPLPGHDETVGIDVTIGLSFGQEHPLEHADMALGHAKKEHKVYAVYNTLIDTTETVKEQLQWKERIKTAIEERRVEPFFQPIVDRDGCILKYESLMRIAESTPKGTHHLSPALFLDIAVKTKQYRALSVLMVDRVLDGMHRHRETISINLAYEDIADKGFRHHLYERLRSEGVAGRVILEIVENQSVEDYRMLKEFTDTCRLHGAKIAIDDFGSGYSNFEHILEIRPDYIKIDGSLVQNIDVDEHAFILSRAITRFCKELGICVIAEYVHSRKVFELLSEIGVDEFQGYYFSPPEPSFYPPNHLLASE